MEITEMEEGLKVLGSCISQIKWRLKAQSKRRLEIDILGLCTGLRSVVMVDYGGKLPELKERLCAVVKLCQKVSPLFESLRVLVIEEMIYLVHKSGFAEFCKLSISSEAELFFVDLEHDPPQMIERAETCPLGMQLNSIQKLFSSIFSSNVEKEALLSSDSADHMANGSSPSFELSTSQAPEFIDLTSCMHDSQITIPTLNGWLLGYPVVYLFGKDSIPDAICNLSTQALRIFRILVCRNSISSKGPQQEELMSFSVPYELSMRGRHEPWAEAFFNCMQAKWERCKPAWKFLQMEVSECYPQAIVL